MPVRYRWKYIIALCALLTACGNQPASNTTLPAPTPATPLQSTPAPTIIATNDPTAAPNPVHVTVWNTLGVTLQPSDVGVRAGQPVADQSAIQLADGRVRLYFFAQEKGIMSAVSDDGITFEPEAGLRLPDGNGMPRAIVLDDGHVRLYFMTGDGIGSALSSDGLTFTVEPGMRLRNSDAPVAAMSGISVTTTSDGYRAYFSDLPRPGEGPKPHRVYSATSADGLAWTFDDGVRVGATATANDTDAMAQSAEHPMVVREADGSYTMYFARNQTIMSATSLDGTAWYNELTTGVMGNDPDVLLAPDGTHTLYYGDFDQQVGGFLLVARQANATWDVAIERNHPEHITLIISGNSDQPLTISAGKDTDAASYTITPAQVSAPGSAQITLRFDHPFMPSIRVSDGTITRIIPVMSQPAPKP